MNILLSEINVIIGGQLTGDETTRIHGFSSIDDVTPQALIFIESEKYQEQAKNSPAAAVIISTSMATLENKPCIQVEKPMLAFMQLLKHFFPDKQYSAGIHPTAVIADDADIHPTAHIGPHVTIGRGTRIGAHTAILAGCVLSDNVKIGDNCCLHPRVVMYDNSEMGNRSVLHAGCVIGSDGFGYRLHEGIQQKVPHVGNVVIADDVEIGANTVVDRASLGSTRIGTGTKIDNLVQIAHSVQIGQHNIICSMTGVAGSARTGNHVTLAANVGVSDHVIIEDNVILGARTGVAPQKRLPKGTVWLGNPARPKDKTIEQVVALQQLPELMKKVRALMKNMRGDD